MRHISLNLSLLNSISKPSEVASLAEAGGAEVDQGKRYAELW